MGLNTTNPTTLAKGLLAMSGGSMTPDRAKAKYLETAAMMRAIAAKAAASPRGRDSGYTEADALKLAERAERNAEMVPAELAKLKGVAL